MQVVKKSMTRSLLICACLSSASILGNEVGNSSCILTNVSFPRGNVLVWMACLQQNLSEQNRASQFRVIFDFGLPVISNAVFRGDAAVIRNLSDSTMSNFVHSLEGRSPALGLGILQGPVQIGAASLQEILTIIQISFRCQATIEAGNVHVRLFPHSLVIYAYRLNQENLRDGGDVIVAAYGGDGHDPLEGVVCEVPTQGIVYVLAPPARHDRATKVLATLKEHWGGP